MEQIRYAHYLRVMESTMATHQEIGGMSDEELLQRLVTSHPERYGEAFWEFFAAQVGPRLPARPVVMDLAVGQGCFCAI